MTAIDPILYAVGLFGVAYCVVVLAVSATSHREVLGQFFGWAGPFFIIPAVGFVMLVLGWDLGDQFLLFVAAELAYTMFIFRGYLKGLLGRPQPVRPWTAVVLLGAVQPYVAASMTIISIYFAFTVTGSLLQRIFVDRRGSFLIVGSLLLLSTSVVAGAFYELQGYSVFFEVTALAFLVSVMLFELPLVVNVPSSATVDSSLRAKSSGSSPTSARE